MRSTPAPDEHLTSGELYGVLEDRWPHRRQRDIEQHLDRCPECVETLAMVLRAERPASREEQAQLARVPPTSTEDLVARLSPAIAASSDASAARRRLDWKPVVAAVLAMAALFGAGLTVYTRYWLPSESRRLASQALDLLVELRQATGRIPLRYIPEFDRASVTRSGFDTPNPAEAAVLEKLRAAVERAPEPEAVRTLALLLLDEGELEEAERLLRQISDADPDSVDALNGLAVVYYERAQRQGEDSYVVLQRGLAFLRQAQAAQPEDLRVLYNFGKFYEALGMEAAAVKAWTRYLERDPSSQWAEEAAYQLAQIAPRQ